MTAFIAPASFQDIDKAFEIGIHVSMGMIDRMAHAGLSRKMDHRGEPMLCKQSRHWRTIRKIGLHETEPRIVAQNIQPRLLQCRVIISVETVQTGNVAAFGQQPTRDMKADETRSPRNQYCLIRHRIPGATIEARRFGSAAPALSLFTRRIEGVAIPSCAAIARLALKPY